MRRLFCTHSSQVSETFIYQKPNGIVVEQMLSSNCYTCGKDLKWNRRFTNWYDRQPIDVLVLWGLAPMLGVVAVLMTVAVIKG